MATKKQVKKRQQEEAERKFEDQIKPIPEDLKLLNRIAIENTPIKAKSRK